MKRRDFLRAASGISASSILPKAAFAASVPARRWRTFEVTTRVEVLKPAGVTRLWVPAALLWDAPYQRTISNRFHGDERARMVVENRAEALGLIAAEYPAGVKPELTVTSRIATRDWTVPLSASGKPPQASRAELNYCLRPTRLIPTDGIVRETAARITRGAKTDVDKARAIYEWIVENTYRNPKTRGCGLGDIRFMLESRDLGGKCADLNALYVGLARAAGLPARDVYGVRVAPSRLGYKSLGTSSVVVTKAQHCRAEVYLSEHGWAPVDPADVRKVMLEEPPGNRPIDDRLVERARERLFGSWEMNWMAYNFAHDVVLPGSSGQALPFLMYPQAETGERRLDSLDAETFAYEIQAREIHAG